MGLFDSLANSLKSSVQGAANRAVSNAKEELRSDINDAVAKAAQPSERKSFVFESIPGTLEEFKALPGTDLTDPFAVCALTIVALNAYAANPAEGLNMLNFLKGPQPLSTFETSFLKEHMTDYLARSYFAGATPDNDYTPDMPYTVEIFEQAHSLDQKGEGYILLHVRSGGADSPRDIKLRTKPSTSQWFMWEQFLLPGIREPKSADPWA